MAGSEFIRTAIDVEWPGSRSFRVARVARPGPVSGLFAATIEDGFSGAGTVPNRGVLSVAVDDTFTGGQLPVLGVLSADASDTFSAAGTVASGVVTARYWRIRNRAAYSDYCDLQSVAGAGFFASSDLTGTNLAAGLLNSTPTIQYRNGSNVALAQTASGGGNPLTASGQRLYTNAASFALNDNIWMDFGSPVSAPGSLKYQQAAASRQPRDMALEYSSDNSSWTEYCLLTNATPHATAHFRSITSGGTIAATSS